MFCNRQWDSLLLITLCIEEEKNVFLYYLMIHSKYQNRCNTPTKIFIHSFINFIIFKVNKKAALFSPKYLNTIRNHIIKVATLFLLSSLKIYDVLLVSSLFIYSFIYFINNTK